MSKGLREVAQRFALKGEGQLGVMGGERARDALVDCANVRVETDAAALSSATFVVEALWAHLERFPAEPGEPIVRMPNGLWVDSDRFGHPWRTACRRAGARAA